ncbi:hypothetical protein [Salinisphaera sp. T31B1]|uniref:hypothetical protein n=1 Tax=Salinisphaera sp. T31B1 TaxID=727963 RepID=UPI00333F13C3
MKKIIIHAGMPKTGTTAIQKQFGESSAWCADNGLLYPVAGRYGGSFAHHTFFLSFVNDRVAINTPELVNMSHATCMESLDAMSEEIRHSSAQRVMLSSELVWNPAALNRSELEKIRSFFKDYKVQIVIFLRDIKSHALSSYAQRITGPQKYRKNIVAHLEEMHATGQWDYCKRIDDFCNVFGKTNVHLFWHEDYRNGITTPFMHFFNAQNSPLEYENQNINTINSSEGWALIMIFRRVNILKNPKAIKATRIAIRAIAAKIPKFLMSYAHRLMRPLNRADEKKLDAWQSAELTLLARRYSLKHHVAAEPEKVAK